MTVMVEKDSAAPVEGGAHEAGQVQVPLCLSRTDGMPRLETEDPFDSKKRIPDEAGDEEAAFGWSQPTCWTAKA